MKVLIAGSSGFVGSALTKFLTSAGHQVIKLVRDRKKIAPDTIYWNPDQGELDKKQLEDYNIEAVINLAGENVAEGRWTDDRKRKILESRVKATTLLSIKIAAMKEPPKVFISASAIGVYGDQGEQICSENTPLGEGFLASVCRRWEAATAPADAAGIRTIQLRIGIVLAKNGGALKKMLLPFKLGLGGRIGPGTQYMSWIALEDLCAIILFLLQHDSLNGIVNAVAPYAVTNARFTSSLAKTLSRPAFLPVPAGILLFLCGREMANDFFLSSVRVVPKRLIDQGYVFHYPHVEEALKKILE